MISIHPVEAVWLASNSLAFVITAFALWDAWHLRHVANGARRLVARGNIRREVFRLAVQSLLIVVIVPGLFVDREIVLTIPILCLIAVPVILLIATIFDAIDRRTIVRLSR